MGENILIPSLVGGIPSILIIFTIVRSYVNTSKIDNFCDRMDKLEDKQQNDINRIYDHCGERFEHCADERRDMVKRMNGLYDHGG